MIIFDTILGAGFIFFLLCLQQAGKDHGIVSTKHKPRKRHKH